MYLANISVINLRTRLASFQSYSFERKDSRAVHCEGSTSINQTCSFQKKSPSATEQSVGSNFRGASQQQQVPYIFGIGSKVNMMKGIQTEEQHSFRIVLFFRVSTWGRESCLNIQKATCFSKVIQDACKQTSQGVYQAEHVKLNIR